MCSNGGKSRPTFTHWFAQAFRNSAAVRPTSTKMKFALEAVALQPSSSNTFTVMLRTSVLRAFSCARCCGLPMAAIAAAMPKTLTLYGIFTRASGLIVSAWPTA